MSILLRTLAAIALLACAGCDGGAGAENTEPAQAIATDRADKPRLVLVTSLPLAWPEESEFGDVLDGNAPVHPVFAALKRGYRVVPFDTIADPAALRDAGVLLMAQPRPLTPQEYVVLDDWVQAGGRLVLLADPLLGWPSVYPLGDARRPLPAALLSPIFTRWGVEFRFDTEADDGVRALDWEGGQVAIAAAGHFALLAKPSAAECSLRMGGYLADCAVGKGRALLFGDADFLNEAMLGRGQNMAFLDFLLSDVAAGGRSVPVTPSADGE